MGTMQPAPVSIEELLAQSRWLRSLASTLVVGEAAAEDLVQETWLAVLRHPPRKGGAPRPWLARIARNLAANFRRGEGRRDQHERRAAAEGAGARDEAVSGADPLQLASEVELQRLLAEAVLRLGEPERSMVVLRHLRGLDSRAIGARLGLPAGTVRWRLKRALEALRADLDRRHAGRREGWLLAFAAWARPTRELPPPGAVAERAGAFTLRNALAGAAVLVAGLGLGAAWLAGDAARAPREAELETAGIALARAPSTPRLVTAPLPAPTGEAAEPPDTARVALPATRATDARPSPGGRRAPIRGRLRIRDSDEPLDEVLTIQLRTGDLSVKETVTSAPDGSFRTGVLFPRGYVLARVLRPDGATAVDHEGLFDPRTDEDWLVPVPWPTFARGRLLDLHGAPLEGVELRLAMREDEGPGLEQTGPDGTFLLKPLPTGLHRLLLQRGFEEQELQLAVTRGPNELGDVLTSFRSGASITGCVRAEDAEAFLLLTDVVTGRASIPGLEWDENGLFFCFADVPPGDYRLTPIAFDGRRYEPSSLRVSPPATDLEFRAVGEQETFCPQLRSLQGDPPQLLLRLEGVGWLARSGCPPRALVERWVVLADRHRPVSGGPPTSSELEVDAALGWGRAVLFHEAGPTGLLERPLADGEVLADGVAVARSDADGLALVSLEREPEELDYRLDGWVVHGERHDGRVIVVTFVRP